MRQPVIAYAFEHVLTTMVRALISGESEATKKLYGMSDTTTESFGKQCLLARRFVEGMMKRGPLDEEQKKRGATAVHYALGAAFGAAWGLLRESYPKLNGPLGVAGFGVAAWMLGDNLLYPSYVLPLSLTNTGFVYDLLNHPQ